MCYVYNYLKIILLWCLLVLNIVLGNMDVDFYSVQFEVKMNLSKRDLKPLLNLLSEAS